MVCVRRKHSYVIWTQKNCTIKPFKAYWLLDASIGLTFKQRQSAHSVWGQLATFALYNIRRRVFITEMASVDCAVRIGTFKLNSLRFVFKGFLESKWKWRLQREWARRLNLQSSAKTHGSWRISTLHNKHKWKWRLQREWARRLKLQSSGKTRSAWRISTLHNKHRNKTS